MAEVRSWTRQALPVKRTGKRNSSEDGDVTLAGMRGHFPDAAQMPLLLSLKGKPVIVTPETATCLCNI